MGSISEKLITHSKADPGRMSAVPILRDIHLTVDAAFDPKPFIRTFEAAVDRLIAVRKDVQAKSEQLEKNVRMTEREYSKKMGELNRGFDVRFGTTVMYLISWGLSRQLVSPSLVWRAR